MDKILSLLQMDIGEMLPELDSFLSDLVGTVRLIVLLGPVILLALGAWYYFIPPKEANHRAGFRTYLTMGSVEAWRFAQKLAGIGYMALGGALTVIVGIISLFFTGKEALTMIHIALVCVIVELILVLIVWIGVNLLVFRVYDKDGKRRKR